MFLPPVCQVCPAPQGSPDERGRAGRLSGVSGKRVRRDEGMEPESEPVVRAEPAVQPPAEALDEPLPTSDAIWTLPNLLSAIRILLVPVFLWLVLGPEADLLAIGVLIVSGITDYLDGMLARKLGQTTRIGAILDPVADRMYILAVVIGLGLRDIIPWWLAVILPLRDVVLFSLIPFLRTRGYSALPVHFLGKAATAALLYAFPLLLLGDGTGAVANLARVFGWAFTIWGVGLYWWAGILYVFQLRRLLATTPRVR